MCAIIDTYVGTVVAMVFGGSVMGTLLCSSHSHPTTQLPPNNTTTSPTSHSHNTSQQHINVSKSEHGEPQHFSNNTPPTIHNHHIALQQYINLLVHSQHASNNI